MNAVEVILRFVAVFRRYGVPVTFEPGWETRGNGSLAAYRGGLVHHTVTPISNTRPQSLVTGRPDLSGPLCQFGGLGNGGVHVVAAQPANHAGASGGRSMGPLPVTRLFNPLVVGIEMIYPGTSPMTPAQYRTVLVFAIACAEIFGSVETCRAHFETSIEGKIDIAYAANPTRSYDMNQVRREALQLKATGAIEEDDMYEPSDRERDKGTNKALGQFETAYKNKHGEEKTLGLAMFELYDLIDDFYAAASDAGYTDEKDLSFGRAIFEVREKLRGGALADVDEAELADELAKRGIGGADAAAVKAAVAEVLARTSLTVKETG